MFEINFNNNNSNLKMYSLDTFGNKYNNRLDLYTHSYFNGSLYLNLVTFIVPKFPHIGGFHVRGQNDTDKHKGDGAHLFLDLFTNLSLANVYDTGSSTNKYPQVNYNVKTISYGINFKYSTTSGVYNTPFNIELGAQLFWLFTSSNAIDPNLNAQYNSISDIKNLQNSSKTILSGSPSVYPFFSLNALVQYNTNPKTSSSNVFIHYRYIENYVFDTSPYHYHNSFFEFQLGYALDLSKLISPPPAAKGAN